MIENLASRKFLLAAICLLLTYVALFTGKLEGAEVVALVGLILGIFSSANVAAKHKAFIEGK